ncbi:hypothetical protein [Actinoplanes sp. NPDC051494]|uniref:hypothetical protein n=1 Tax=Actinoplanes sp. NPDC051494 TaxID=3363907 RepID=UPI0037A7D724
MPTFRMSSTLTLLGVLLAAAACDGDAAPAPAPDPSASYLAEVRTALDRTRNSPFSWGAAGDVPGNFAGQAPDIHGEIRTSGFYDPGTRNFYRNLSIEGAYAKTWKGSAQTVIGNDFYLSDQPPQGEYGPASHIDLDRVPPDTILYSIDRDDPTGIDRFTAAVRTVMDKAGHQYRGTFDPGPDPAGHFLPLGAPVVGGTGVFTLITGDAGEVETIDVMVRPGDGSRLRLKTLFTFHGRQFPIKPPPAADEADPGLLRKDGEQ